MYLRKPMEAGLIILALGGTGAFWGWLIDLMLGVSTGAVTPICVLWVDMGRLLNSADPGRGDITACGIGRRGVSVGIDNFWVI